MLLPAIDFKGEIPKRHPRLLPPNFAQSAANTRLEDGSISPVRAPLTTTDLSAITGGAFTPVSFGLYGGTWRCWSSSTISAVPAPIAEDRLYVTGNGAPQVIAGATTYQLAVAAPTVAPTVAVQAGTVDPATSELVTYCYAWVTELDEESAPSPVSALIETSASVTLRVNGWGTVPVGRGINRIRVYRSQTSATGVTDFYFVKDLTIPNTFFDHLIATDPLNEAMSTAHFDIPSANLEGITALPNGIMAGFYGKTLAFSEPYRPHAWPQSYELKTDYPIVALAAFGSMLAVMTTGTPYLVDGTHPDSMAMRRLEENLPCTSARGVVDLGYAAAYPSHTGLVVIDGSGARVVTKELFSREQWANLSPSTIRAGTFDGRYVFTFNGSMPRGGTEKAAMIDLMGATPYLIRLDATIESLFSDQASGKLYIRVGDIVTSWDDPASATHLSQRWWSKEAVLPYAVNFGWLLVRGKQIDPTFAFTLDIFADGALVFSTSEINTPVRLPSGFRAETWELALTGTVEITSISLAETVDELMGQP